MRKSLKSALAAALCGTIAFAAPPAEVLAGPMTAASPLSVGMTAPAEKVYYRRHYGPRRYYGGHYRRGYGGYYRRGYGGYYRRGYYRNYGYDPSGAMFAGAALGLLGAGIAGASGYGYGYPGFTAIRATATAIRATATAIRAMAAAGAGEPWVQAYPKAGGKVEPHATLMDELLSGRNRQQSVASPAGQPVA